MINLTYNDKLIIEEALDNYFNYSINELNLFEENIQGKKINLMMDGSLFDKNLMYNDCDCLNISINSSILYFTNNNIKIDYIYTAFGNITFLKNLINNIKYDKLKINNINILSLQNNNLFREFKSRGKCLSDIKEEDLNNATTNLKMIELFKKNFINFTNLKRCHKIKINKSIQVHKTSNVLWYKKLKCEYSVVLTAGILTILHLLKLKCEIYINGFNFNLIDGNYHTMDYYKHTPEHHYRTEMSSLELTHLKNTKFIKGIEQDKYVLYLLKNKFNDKLHFQKEIEVALNNIK